ncbi:helix-turn-helix domain-containing protein [Butyricicoccus sp.]|uniref:helix-turn-helix domain-containing protein n=1 Tax=Butyricicoccus sp. TaxID=2049021 RepID=UPI003F16F8DF
MYFKRIEDMRIDHDLTQQDVADILQIQREVYRRYEKGTRTIPVEYLIQLAQYYHTSVDYLLGLTETDKWNETES